MVAYLSVSIPDSADSRSSSTTHCQSSGAVVPKSSSPSAWEQKLEYIVDGDHPDDLAVLFIHDRRHSQVEVRHLAHCGPKVPVRMHVGGVRRDHGSKLCCWFGPEQVDERNRTQRTTLLVVGKHDIKSFGRRRTVAYSIENVSNRGIKRETDEIGGHQPARSLGVVTEQRTDLSLLGLREQIQDGRRRS